VDETTIGNDTFRIQNGEVNTGDLFDGGLGNSDKILNVGGPIGLTQFGVAGINYASTIFAAFAGAPSAAGATYKNVEIFDGNNGTITGSNNGFNILDFSGFQTATKLGTINTLNATNGADYVNVSTADAGVTITGGGGSQIVVGSGYADTISTGSGNDTINAGAGDDTITGGGGADSMDGGDGSDTYNIAGAELGGDTFNDTGTSGTDTINVTGALSTFLSFGVFGTNYNAINPNLPFSALATYQGIEIFDGNNFAISGVNNGSDIFDLSGFSSATQVGAINTFNATGGTDYVNVSTADAGVTITGGAGTQIIVGSAYADTLTGGGGNDTLTGGSGDDRFYFNTALNASTNLDTITDFKTGGDADTIRLSSAIFTGLSTGILAGTDFGTAAAVGADVVYSGGGLYFKAGGSANIVYYTQFAILTGSPAVSNSDIVVF
jgi:Ca2+-binding RTX toxin-like protein